MVARVCPIAQAMRTMPEDERPDFQAVLDNHLSSTIISQWLTHTRGYTGCTITAVKAHRDGTCGCEQ